MSRGDLGGFEDLERAVELAVGDPRLETRVRCLVNAAGSAFRVGRLADVERLVATGLPLAEECEFFAGQYRLRLTRAAARASSGAWDAAVDELEDLLRSPGEPGIMAPLARSILARLLARRGQPQAGAVLAAAGRTSAGRRAPSSPASWRSPPRSSGGSTARWPRPPRPCGRPAPGDGRGVRRGRGRAHGVPPAGRTCRSTAPADPPGPWAPTLAGRTAEAVAAWARSGSATSERSSRPVPVDPAQRDEGLKTLVDLGAVATIPAVG